MFVAPLWLVYEGLTFWLNHGREGQLRTGLDLLLKRGLGQLGIGTWQSVVLIAFCFSLIIFWRIRQIRKLELRAVYFGVMLLESLFYALLFGLVVGGMAHFFLRLPAEAWREDRLASLILHLGAGVYEEFVFRFALISGILWVATRLLKRDSQHVYGLAVVVSSFLFASFHYMGAFGEPFTVEGFVFRVVAGGVLGCIFIFRGYGIAAYTHSLYNILLVFR